MNKAVLIPEENIIQLLVALNEFKKLYQDQVVGNNSHLAHDKYLTERQAASFLKSSISKIQIFRKNGNIEYFKFGRRIFYKQAVLEQFIESNSFGPFDGGSR